MNRIRDEVRLGARAHPLKSRTTYLAPTRRLLNTPIVTRVVMDGTYEPVAQALGKPSADAARIAVSRALLRLAQEMSRVAKP